MLKIDGIGDVTKKYSFAFSMYLLGWLLSVTFYPGLDPLLQSMPYKEALKDLFSISNLMGYLASISILFIVTTILSFWIILHLKLRFIVLWAFLTGVYIAFIHMPSRYAQQISILLDANYPLWVSIIGHILLFAGAPFVFAMVLRWTCPDRQN